MEHKHSNSRIEITNGITEDLSIEEELDPVMSDEQAPQPMENILHVNSKITYVFILMNIVFHAFRVIVHISANLEFGLPDHRRLDEDPNLIAEEALINQGVLFWNSFLLLVYFILFLGLIYENYTHRISTLSVKQWWWWVPAVYFYVLIFLHLVLCVVTTTTLHDSLHAHNCPTYWKRGHASIYDVEVQFFFGDHRYQQFKDMDSCSITTNTGHPLMNKLDKFGRQITKPNIIFWGWMACIGLALLAAVAYIICIGCLHYKYEYISTDFYIGLVSCITLLQFLMSWLYKPESNNMDHDTFKSYTEYQQQDFINQSNHKCSSFNGFGYCIGGIAFIALCTIANLRAYMTSHSPDNQPNTQNVHDLEDIRS